MFLERFLVKFKQRTPIDPQFKIHTIQGCSTAKDAKEKTIEHEKAILIEAIFGVTYLEFGFQNLVRILPHVQYPA